MISEGVGAKMTDLLEKRAAYITAASRVTDAARQDRINRNEASSRQLREAVSVRDKAFEAFVASKREMGLH